MGAQHQPKVSRKTKERIVSDKKTAHKIGATRKQTRVDKEMEFLLTKCLERHPDHEGAIDPDAICAWALEDGI